MSTLRTLAPSFASRAANGRPTTSDLADQRSSAMSSKDQTYLLMTVITFPLALSPYSSILL